MEGCFGWCYDISNRYSHASESGTAWLHLTTTIDPATNEEIGTIPEMGLKETQEAVEAAKTAFTSWKSTTAKVSLSFPEALISCVLIVFEYFVRNAMTY